MKLAFYDPKPTWNEYVEQRWFAPLMAFCRDNGIPVKEIQEPIPEFGWTMVCNAHHLTPGLVRHFDDNRCPFVAFSCNDSAYLTERIRDFFHHIPLLFTISGVQKVNFSNRCVMNPDMSVSLEPVQYLPDEEWERYSQMRDCGRLLPLPYVPWDRLPDVPIPEVKTPKVLFRGGNHFWRFVAYLHALRFGVAHPASGFLTADYFREDMVPQFRYCPACQLERSRNGGRLAFGSISDTCQCELGLSLEEPLKWNNRTPRAFFRLAQHFELRDGIGNLDRSAVEMALNFKRQSAHDHLRAVADAQFFCEAKWQFSIPMPQRFWEAASVNTVNLLPRRTNDQEYFPVLRDMEHYVTFADDFRGIENYVGHDTLPIAANARMTYERWIRPGRYCTNENLLEHITQRIREVAG